MASSDRQNCGIISPPGIAMPLAGLCFTYISFFFKCRPSHSNFDNGWTDRNADYCVNTVDEKKSYG